MRGSQKTLDSSSDMLYDHLRLAQAVTGLNLRIANLVKGEIEQFHTNLMLANIHPGKVAVRSMGRENRTGSPHLGLFASSLDDTAISQKFSNNIRHRSTAQACTLADVQTITGAI